MKVNINSNGLYSVTSMDAKTLNTVMFVLDHVRERCFSDYDSEGDKYFSGDGVCMALSSEELRKFHGFVDGFWIEYENLKSRLNIKKRR